MIEAGLSDEDRQKILALARRSIIQVVTDTDASPDEPLPPNPEFEVTGVFVTVRVRGLLRGCIGFVDMRTPFSVSLIAAAQRAATEDTRFDSIRADELDVMTVDVTLLYPLEDITEASDILLGTHGLRIDLGGRRGLLLPQVAIEQKWTAEEFLQGVCRKAMLPINAWRDRGARLSRFRGVVLKEDADGDEEVSPEQLKRTV